MTDTYTGLEPWNELDEDRYCKECGSILDLNDECPNWCNQEKEEEDDKY